MTKRRREALSGKENNGATTGQEVSVAMSLDDRAGGGSQPVGAEKQAKMSAHQRYEAPKLVRYGHVAQLTEAGKSRGANDGQHRPFVGGVF